MFESLFWVSLIEVSIIFEMEKDYFRSKKYTQYDYFHLETNSITSTSLTNFETSAKKTMQITPPV